MPKESSTPPQLLRGMKDILPVDQEYWDWIYGQIQRLAADFSFQRIETPVLEATSLFNRSVGDQTDIIQKEMYTFTDKNGDSVSLRPENTAGVVRAYIEHGMLNQPQPVKLWYFGPFFRHDRPQAGRYRQFWQYGFEVFGADQPIIEAQLILLTRGLFTALGIETTLQINSIGNATTRQHFTKALQAFMKNKKSELSDDQRLLLQKNPLRLLDSKDEKIRSLLEGAPQMLDYLDDESKQHFEAVVEYLDELDIPFVLNPRLVRGLDYYNRTVFEFWAAGDDTGATSLAGGGRYDRLVEQLGGRPTPAIGLAGGIERLILTLKEKQIAPPPPEPPELYLAQLGEPARKKMLRLFDQLRSHGLRVAESMTKDGLKQQLENANKVGAHYTLIIGQKELMDDTVLIRDMENGMQEVVAYDKTPETMQKRLAKSRANGVKPVTGQVQIERSTLRDPEPSEVDGNDGGDGGDSDG